MSIKRVPQSKIEELKMLVLSDEHISHLVRMMFYRVIQDSEGLSVSVRITKSLSEDDTFSPLIDNIRDPIRELNAKVMEMGLSGRFRWMLGQYSFVIWYDANGMTENYYAVANEIGTNIGGRSELIVYFSDRLPEGSCQLEVNKYSGMGPVRILPFLDAMATIIAIREMLPNIKVTLSNEPDGLKDKSIEAISVLLQTRAEKEALEEEEKQRPIKGARAKKSK